MKLPSQCSLCFLIITGHWAFAPAFLAHNIRDIVSNLAVSPNVPGFNSDSDVMAERTLVKMSNCFVHTSNSFTIFSSFSSA